MIKIEKNIPIPKNTTNKYIYPTSELEVGDSFFVAVEGKGKINTLRSSLHMAGSRCGQNRKFTVRQVDGGLRCWRIE